MLGRVKFAEKKVGIPDSRPGRHPTPYAAKLTAVVYGEDACENVLFPHDNRISDIHVFIFCVAILLDPMKIRELRGQNNRAGG